MLVEGLGYKIRGAGVSLASVGIGERQEADSR